MIKNLNELLQWIGVISLNYLLSQEKELLPIIMVILSLSLLINLQLYKKNNLTILLMTSFIIYCTITFMNKTKTEDFLTHCWYCLLIRLIARLVYITEYSNNLVI